MTEIETWMLLPAHKRTATVSVKGQIDKKTLSKTIIIYREIWMQQQQCPYIFHRRKQLRSLMPFLMFYNRKF